MPFRRTTMQKGGAYNRASTVHVGESSWGNSVIDTAYTEGEKSDESQVYREKASSYSSGQ